MIKKLNTKILTGEVDKKKIERLSDASICDVVSIHTHPVASQPEQFEMLKTYVTFLVEARKACSDIKSPKWEEVEPIVERYRDKLPANLSFLVKRVKADNTKIAQQTLLDGIKGGTITLGFQKGVSFNTLNNCVGFQLTQPTKVVDNRKLRRKKSNSVRVVYKSYLKSKRESGHFDIDSCDQCWEKALKPFVKEIGTFDCGNSDCRASDHEIKMVDNRYRSAINDLIVFGFSRPLSLGVRCNFNTDLFLEQTEDEQNKWIKTNVDLYIRFKTVFFPKNMNLKNSDVVYQTPKYCKGRSQLNKQVYKLYENVLNIDFSKQRVENTFKYEIHNNLHEIPVSMPRIFKDEWSKFVEKAEKLHTKHWNSVYGGKIEVENEASTETCKLDKTTNNTLQYNHTAGSAGINASGDFRLLKSLNEEARLGATSLVQDYLNLALQRCEEQNIEPNLQNIFNKVYRWLCEDVCEAWLPGLVIPKTSFQTTNKYQNLRNYSKKSFCDKQIEALKKLAEVNSVSQGDWEEIEAQVLKHDWMPKQYKTLLSEDCEKIGALVDALKQFGYAEDFVEAYNLPFEVDTFLSVVDLKEFMETIPQGIRVRIFHNMPYKSGWIFKHLFSEEELECVELTTRLHRKFRLAYTSIKKNKSLNLLTTH